MRKTYMMLVAMVLSVLGATTVTAQKIYKAELDKSMFKAWDGYGANANVVEEPEAIDDGAATFNCENNLYKQLEGGNVVFGNTNVYYLWYADITGTKTFNAEGTPGLQLRVLMNRPEPVEGGDAHGGQSVERMLTIGENGVGSLDVSDMEYVHLNCIKVNWGGSGIVRNFYIEGTVKPVTGILSMINNGDAEGDDLSSFPVSYDGPNNGDSANDKPEIVAGGVRGSKCFKVTSYPDPTQTWHTQFYIKADEVMPKGSKWRLIMSVKADHDTKITTSAQAQPRAWKGGFISEFKVGTEWKQYEWSGEIGVDDFQSIAFDLNNGDERNSDDTGWAPGNGGCGFYFDNIEFGYDLGGTNPLNSMVCTYGADAVCINFSDMTNMKELVKKTTDGKTLIFPNDCATLTINGEEVELVSVEGRPDGNLYFFMLTEEAWENDEVVVAFKNPADADHHLVYNIGKWEGMDVPDFSGITGEFSAELSNGGIWSYFWDAPKLQSADPEPNSFNLPGDMKEFKVTFNQNVEVKSVVAKLDGELLTPSGDAEHSPVVILTRSGSNELSGEKTLVISQVKGEKSGIEGEDEYIEVKYSFGPYADDPNDPEETVYTSDFTTGDGENANGAGWKVNADGGGLQDANSSGGCRLMHNQGAFVDDLLYVAQRGTATGGVALYGIEEGYKLALEAKSYNLSLNACRHDRADVALKVQVLPEDAVNEDGTLLDENAILVEVSKEITPEKTSKKFIHFDIDFTPETAGNYVIRCVPTKSNGNFGGYDDCVCFAEVVVKHEPSALGYKENKLLTEALEAAKTAYDKIATASAENNNRYDGTTLTALKNLIDEVEKDKVGYSAPSLYAAKTTELDAAVKAAEDHKAACDSYDEAIKQGIELVDKFKESKFAVTSYYTDLTAVVNKYHGQMEKVNVSEDPEEPIYETNYSYDVLKEDDALAAANTELSTVNNMASKMLTEGKSTKGWQQITTGYAALHERLRRGVELLKSLGVDESEDVIAAANAELGDNDEIAEAIIKRANQIILADLASGESKLFEVSVDDETGIESSASYDLSVFFKNPNVYGPAYSTETPGWTSVQGNCFAWSSWDGASNHSANTPYPEDCDIHAGWHPNPYAMVEQTVENLPVGIYTVKIKCNDNGNSWESSDAETPGSNTCAFIRTSESPEIEPGADIDRETDFYAYVLGSNDIEEVPVTDGKLSVGFYYGNTSQAFFEDVEVWMTAPIAGHDYGKDYQEVLASVETAKTAKVRGLELYDLNGRRITTARKGLVIVKKYMSDGTVKTEKVIK